MTEAQQRETAFDAYRGIAICVVVYAHVAAYAWDLRDDPSTQFIFFISLYLRHLSFFVIPTFLFVSGYFLATSRFESPGSYRRFLKKRVSRVAVPYLFWSLFFIAYGSLKTRTFSPGNALWLLLTGQAEGPYFFVNMLLQFYLLTPLFVYLAQRRATLKWVLLAHLLFVVFLYVIRLCWWPNLLFTYVKLPFITWLSFFYLGMAVRYHPDILERYRVSWAAIFVAVFYVLSLIEATTLYRFGYLDFAISEVTITSFLAALGGFALEIGLRHRSWPSLLVSLGSYSFGVFLIHGFVMRGCVKLMAQVGVVPASLAFQPVLLLGTLLISCGIIYITGRVIGPRWAAGWLGF